MTFKKTELSRAISSAIIASAAVTMATGPTNALAQDELSERSIDEIIVTASRRSENAQDVPITLLVMNEESLENLGIESFEDYIALLPGVSGPGQGPGEKDVFFRGISAGRGGVRGAGTLGSEPSVGFYLDEWPITAGGRTIDLYTTDLNRIEVLKGPQGTLFGASSQGGTIRLITNKPVLNEFQAGGDFSYSDTSGGETSNQVEGYLNIPITDDKLAIRFAGYNATQGGFIDNIAGTRQISLDNPGLVRGGIVPSVRATVSNVNVAEQDFNDATYRGLRTSVYYAINDDWDFLLQQTNQTLVVEGVWEFDPVISNPSAGQLNMLTFEPDKGDDEVNLTAYTLNGRLGQLELIYNGSYMERQFDGVGDYTGYAAVGPSIPYYICSYPGYDECGTPNLFTTIFSKMERFNQEIRVATDPSRRWRAIVGVFYDDTETTERSNFVYPASIAQGFAPNAPVTGATSSDPTTRPPGVTFFNDFIRLREEFSVFGEFSFDITDNFTATFGLRSYSIEIALNGNSSFAQRGVDGDAGNNVDAILGDRSPTTLDDVIYKGNLSWNVSDDFLLFATYSEGFRAGFFNRNGQSQVDPLQIPFFIESDEVVNYEIGWKTLFLDGTLRFNGAAYFIEFSGLQSGILDFSIDNSGFTDNVGEAEIFGVEFDVEWAATDNLRLFGAFTTIDSEMVKIPVTVVNLAPVGSDLAFAPEIQYNVGARYEREFGDNLLWFAQGVVKYTDEQFSDLVLADRFLQDDYYQADFSVGFSRDDWRVTLFVNNANNSVGETYINPDDRLVKISPTRPRTIGLRLSYDYGR